MLIQNIKPKYSGLKYNSKVNELILISDLVFSFNIQNELIELDQNPFGDPSLVSINDFKKSEDNSLVTFQSKYRGKEASFNISLENSVDKVVFNTIKKINDKTFKPLFSETDLDKIDLQFLNGKLSKLYLYKYKDFNLIDSLSVVNENEGLYLIKQNPWSKILLNQLTINKDVIKCEGEKESFNYTLNLNQDIISMITELLQV